MIAPTRLAVFSALLLVPPLASAVAPQRAFVATSGHDANAAANCSVSAPCRSFDTAIGVVATNGEVIALDSGGYGRFTVTKSVTITAPRGVYAGISVLPGTNGVDIATPNIDVILRGLAINGQGGDDGVNFQSGASLVVENCTITGMNVAGVLARAQGSDNAHPAKVLISGTTITKSTIGVEMIDGPVSVTIARSKISGNHSGVEAHGGLAGVEMSVAVRASTISNNTWGTGVLAAADASGAIVEATVSGTTISGNFDNGVYATGVAGGQSIVTLSHNTITENLNGVAVSGSGTLKAIVGENTIARNRSAGLFIAAGTVLSRGDNTIKDNATIDTTSPPGSIGGI